MRVHMTAVIICLLCLAGLGLRAAAQPAEGAKGAPFSRRYVLVFADMRQPAERERLLGIMRRAATVGYNGIMLGPKGGEYIDLAQQGPSLAMQDNFAQIRREAQRLGLLLLPYAINPGEVGYAAPQLREAIPCRGTIFHVQDGIATCVSNPAQYLKNPAFAQAQGNAPDDWGNDKPGVITFLDTTVTHNGQASIRLQDPGKGDPQNGMARLSQQVAVTPFRAYAFSVWMKTQDFTRPADIKFYFEGVDGGQPLVYENREGWPGSAVAHTQEWKQYTVRFNSCSNTKLALFFGAWSNTASGSLWLAGADMHEIGLVKTQRRDSLSITVSAADSTVHYTEGVDYTVGDARLLIPPTSHIPDGARLAVSWYQQADMVGPPFANAAHAEYFAVEQRIAERLDGLFGHPRGFAMTFDEWRVANWDPDAGPISAGEYIANTTRQCTALLKKLNPDYETYVWSDMYDPHENAKEKYYLCNGPLTDSWRGLAPETIMLTWEGGQPALHFFAGHQQRQIIAGYYESLGNVKHWLDDLDHAEGAGDTGVVGFMYTTWENKYDDLESAAALIKAHGRWGSGPAMP